MNRKITDSADENYVDESDDSLDDVGIEAPEKTYKGPHLTFPLKRADLDLLINLFRKKKVRCSLKCGLVNPLYYVMLSKISLSVQVACQVCCWNS